MKKRFKINKEHEAIKDRRNRDIWTLLSKIFINQ